MRGSRRGSRSSEKAGFVREGTLREAQFVEGRWHDEHIYSILRREYKARDRREADPEAPRS